MSEKCAGKIGVNNERSRSDKRPVKAGAPRNIAVWRYDLFPYLLHGKVTGKKQWAGGKEYVQVEGYGGMGFRPVAMLTEAEAAQLFARLDRLKRLRAAVKESTLLSATAACREYGVPGPGEGWSRL